MLSQKVHEMQKAALMQATVNAVVADGVENLTTKAIGNISGVKEVYIYRYFENKEDLVAKTFTECDEAFLDFICKALPVMEIEGIDYEMRCHMLFQKCWDYMLSHSDWLIFYVRYYYSQSFQKYSYADHMQRYDVLIEKIRPVCHPQAEAKTVLHHILDTMIGQARKQLMHPIDPKQAADDTFWLVYSVIMGGKRRI